MRRLTVHVYGDRVTPSELYDDDDSWAPSLPPVVLKWDAARKTGSIEKPPSSRYEVVEWKIVPEEQIP